MSQLVTGEAVALDLREAALPSRMLAALIDATVQFAGFLLLTFLFSLVGASNDAAAAAEVLLILVAVWLGYPVLSETLWKGKTLGKAALGLRVVRDDAGPIGFRQAFVRGLIGFIVERPGLTFYSAAVISSLLNSKGKRLGDLAAGTIVIQERVSGAHTYYAVMPALLVPWAQTLDLTRLPDDLAASVRTFLARAPQLSEASRADLGNRLAGAVAAVTAPPPPPGTPGWAYLTAVLAERRRRAELAAVPAPVVAAPLPPVPAPPPTTAPPPPVEGGFHLPG
ncbi:MAG: RDD family protein [Mycobacteriales bacterium]